MSQKILTSVVLLLAVGSFVVVESQSKQTAHSQSKQELPINNEDCDNSFIADIDAHLQKRFAEDNGKYFGLRRVFRPPAHLQEFFPETAEERETVNTLRYGKYDVYVYLASRRVLGKMPSVEKWSQNYYDRLISDPISLAMNYSQKEVDEMPKPWELWKDAQRAMDSIASSTQQQFTRGKWIFIIRPVRASDVSCLKCHQTEEKTFTYENWADKDTLSEAHKQDTDKSSAKIKEQPRRLKLGDPLGLLLYAYSKKKLRG